MFQLFPAPTKYAKKKGDVLVKSRDRGGSTPIPQLFVQTLCSRSMDIELIDLILLFRFFIFCDDKIKRIDLLLSISPQFMEGLVGIIIFQFP
jgi:hypothetical protein